MSRLLAIAGWAAFTLVMGFGFSVFAYAGANVPADDRIFTPAMFTVAFVCLANMGFGVFAMMDRVFPRI